MFLEGLFKMYIENPALFWQFIYGIAPSFVVGVLYGLLEGSRELNKKITSGWQIFKVVSFTDIASLLWIGHVFDWPLTGMTTEVVMLVVGLYALVLMFPILGGMMTGLYLIKVYWFVKQTVYRFCT